MTEEQLIHLQEKRGIRYKKDRDGGMEMTEGWRFTKLGEREEKGVPVVFQVLLVFAFITHTLLLTLHTACPLWINCTALTDTHTHTIKL